jgi:hypothetical protein
MAYKLIFRTILPFSIDSNEHNLNYEFRVACLSTSAIILYQLFQTVRAFHDDLLKLHRGEKFFRSSLIAKDDDYAKAIKKRNKNSSTITSDALHFPGYLVAHLVYGYVLLFMFIFLLFLSSKILYYMPGVSQTLLQILLPLFILVSFKFVFINYLIKAVFLRDDKQRITNLAPYYVISYFNFFFDCFLGLVACMSRVWQTTILSFMRLPRLDKSMFNQEDELIMRRVDKGHLAYLNYVRMEHWYNNPVLNGFCEMLIESMLYSQIYRAKYEQQAKTAVTARKSSTVFVEEMEVDKDDEDQHERNKERMLLESKPPIKYQFKRIISNTGNSREYTVKEVVRNHPFLYKSSSLKSSQTVSIEPQSPPAIGKVLKKQIRMSAHFKSIGSKGKQHNTFSL